MLFFKHVAILKNKLIKASVTLFVFCFFSYQNFLKNDMFSIEMKWKNIDF